MSEGSSESSKSRSNGEGKERAEIELAIFLVGRNIKVILGSQDFGGIIFVSGSSEELVREDGEFASIKGVELPVTQRNNNVDKHDEANGNI